MPAMPAEPLPLVVSTPLAKIRAWEGVVGEDNQAGRGVGVDEACVYPPQYLATKISIGVPPYFPNVQIFLGPFWSLLWPQSPPYRPPSDCRPAWGG